MTRTWLGSGLPESVSDGCRTVKYTWDEWRGAPLGGEFRVGGLAWKSQACTVDAAGNLTSYIDPRAGTQGGRWT
ncbi:MAG TPA: hypothetical protein VEJ18_11650 [Planctomycetota bacterium]|nr:hypothetical protein [Planctomycetota bacterium]